MRIGIARSLADSTSGGVFQYEMVLLQALSEIATESPHELVYLCYHANDVSILAKTGGLNYHNLPIVPLGIPLLEQKPPDAYLIEKPPTPPPRDPRNIIFNESGANLMRGAGVEIVLLLSPNLEGFSYRLPFVVPVFDLNHRLQPQFPEVSAFGEFNKREYYYINTCRFATLVLVDSETGKSDLLRFYGDHIDEDRVRILQYYPPINRRPFPEADDLVRVREKYKLPSRYFFYPAQFWPHKNHIQIVHAIKLIADQTGQRIPVVFCGAYWYYTMAVHFKELMEAAQKMGVADRISYLGPVPDADMGALYSLSAGLVMPTFFGPTNIPPLEAWHFGRPVITSDIRGVREQIGDAGLLVDPRSPQALAEAMQRIWRDEALCNELAARGRQRLASFSWRSFVDKLTAIMNDACERVRAGRTPRFPDMPRFPDIKSTAHTVQRARR
jgi:glycosyltransferase involved in cell wall biosynthesis